MWNQKRLDFKHDKPKDAAKNVTLARELDMLIAICRVSWKCKLRNLHCQGSFRSSYLRLLHECLHVISVLRRKPHFRLTAAYRICLLATR